MVDESISVELSRHVTDIIGFLRRSTGQNDVIQFHFHWLYNAAVRCDNRGCKHQQRVQVRERLQVIIVLEVVFSAFYVSDDTDFEFIQKK